MILNFPYIDFKDSEWIYILIQYLKGWTEIPLQPIGGYNIDELKFYDGLIGTLLKQTEKISARRPEDLNKYFVNSWKYQGKLYRVMHETYDFQEGSDEPKVFLPEVEYHGMITHWTDDYTFKGLLYKLPKDSECIILEADTAEHFAFDVNKFRQRYNCRELYTEKEREFIFPMYKECIKEYRMTINEFVKFKEKQKE